MYSYFLNWMGPINLEWIKQNGEGWCAGRIDADDWTEFSVPPMRCEDWNRLSDFLMTYETKELANLEKIVQDYEKANPKITWFKDNEKM